MRPSIGIAATVIPALLLVGCTSQGGPMSTPSAPESRPPFQTVPPLSTPSGSPAEVSPSRLKAIKDDLAQHGVTGTPTVVSAESVTWNDSSLGCPRPGMMYSQVITPGMRVVVTVDAKTYDYRFGRSDVPKLCSSAR
jgi:hypothetical protein